MYPIFVLEGSDGSGKTTLAKYLEKEYGFKYRHLTYRFKNKMFTYHHAALEMCLLDAQKGPVVLDRWWPSEVIYADEFRGGSKWPLAYRMFDRAAMKYGLMYIWCLPSSKSEHLKRFERLKGTGREMYDHVSGLIDRYYNLFGKFVSDPMTRRADYIRYDLDYEGNQLGVFCQAAIDRWQANYDRLDPFFMTDRITAGNLVDPKVIFVGDQSNPKTRRPVWPFFEYGNSSLWLAKALESAKIAEADVGWINAHDENGKVNIEQMIRVFQNSPSRRDASVVGLGELSYKATLRYGAGPIFRANHPQWSRRFKPKDFTAYHLIRQDM